MSQGNRDVEIFNVGNDDRISAKDIARIICDVLHLSNVHLNFKNSDDPKGWIGDVTTMQLEISKLKRLGWAPQLSSEEAVIKAANSLLS